MRCSKGRVKGENKIRGVRRLGFQTLGWDFWDVTTFVRLQNNLTSSATKVVHKPALCNSRHAFDPFLKPENGATMWALV
jgi:hypothetical protein